MMFSHQLYYLYDADILVADDDPINLKILVSHLQKAGYSNVRTAGNGIEVMEKIENKKPDLLLLDIIMPEMTGFDVIRKIRPKHSFENLPILVQTSISNAEEQQQAWTLGANDIINKPIQRMELLSRVYIQLHQYLMIKELHEYQQKNQEEMDSAIRLQQSILPQQECIKQIEEQNNVSVHSIFKAYRFLSGDLWGLIPINQDKFAFWSSDFMGKGLQAALNSFRIHTTISNSKNLFSNPSELLKHLNKSLKTVIKNGNFCTFLYGVIDRKNEEITYASAGHPSLLLYSQTNETHHFLNTEGVPLGVDEKSTYANKKASLKNFSNLMIYSDALIESKDILDFALEEDDCTKFIDGLKERSGYQILSNIIKPINGSEITLNDDLTFIEILLK